MSLTLAVVTLVLGAQPGALSLTMPAVNVVNLPDTLARPWETQLAHALGERGLPVQTSRDLAAVLGVERQRALLGCSDDSACIEEIVGALGTDGVVLTDIGRLGATVTVSVRVVNTRTGKAMASAVESGLSPDQVPDALDRAAETLARTLVAPPRWSRWWALVPGLITVASGVLSAVFFVEADGHYQELTSLQLTWPPDAQYVTGATLRDVGQREQTAAVVLAAVAGAGLVASVLTFALAVPSLPAMPTVAPMVTKGAGGVSVSWRWP